MQVNLTTQEIERLSQAFRTRTQRCLTEVIYAMARVGQRIVATMRTEPWNGADALHVRSGALRRGFQSEVGYSGSTVVNMTVSNDVPYARLQEYGGTITPKGHPYLAIPFGAALTGAGVPRFPGGPRTVPDLVLIERRGKNPLLVQRTSRTFTPLFVLVPSVYIPPRLGFRWWFNKIINNPDGALKLELRAAIRRMWGD